MNVLSGELTGNVRFGSTAEVHKPITRVAAFGQKWTLRKGRREQSACVGYGAKHPGK